MGRDLPLHARGHWQDLEGAGAGGGHHRDGNGTAHGLALARAAGFPVVCLHARHAQPALSLQLNKTDRNDAAGLAQLVRMGWYRAVEVKGLESYTLRVLLRVRA